MTRAIIIVLLLFCSCSPAVHYHVAGMKPVEYKKSVPPKAQTFLAVSLFMLGVYYSTGTMDDVFK